MIGALSSLYGYYVIVLGQIYWPFVVLLCYLIFCLFKYCYCIAASVTLRESNVRQVLPNGSSPKERQPLLKPPTTSVVTLKDYDEDDGYADRMINPSRYNIQDAL